MWGEQPRPRRLLRTRPGAGCRGRKLPPPRPLLRLRRAQNSLKRTHGHAPTRVPPPPTPEGEETRLVPQGRDRRTEPTRPDLPPRSARPLANRRRPWLRGRDKRGPCPMRSQTPVSSAQSISESKWKVQRRRWACQSGASSGPTANHKSARPGSPSPHFPLFRQLRRPRRRRGRGRRASRPLLRPCG